MTNLLRLNPQEFVSFLKSEKIMHFFLVWNKQKHCIQVSHKVLEPLGQFLQADQRDFAQHEGLFFQIVPEYDTLQGVFIHKTCRGQAAGGVRYWHYADMEDFLRDGLRLAQGMTHKNALAGIWWGGGKGVMVHNPVFDKNDMNIRAKLYQAFGEFLTSLKGVYVTAEDVGTCVDDMAQVFLKTRFTTCIPTTLGGSGNPSIPTAQGVVCAMEAALEFLKHGSLQGKTVVIQGTGNVGSHLVHLLLNKNVSKIIAGDIHQASLERLKNKIRDTRLELRLILPKDFSLFSIPCDILAPCATGAVLNPHTIPMLQTRIVCGAANNQLEDPKRDDQLLFKRNIAYVPDFLVNRMGIVQCANEQYGYVENDSFIERHFAKDWVHSIYQTTLAVLQESQKNQEPTAKIAIRMAEVLSLEKHPIFGHRAQEIIQSLLKYNWEIKK